MRPIEDDRIQKIDDKFVAHCVCGSSRLFATKHSALRMIERGSCLDCKRDYRNVDSGESGIYQNESGKWCSVCSGCGIEQVYTRKDHAKQSGLCDWQCKKCTSAGNKFSKNSAVGSKQRIYNRQVKMARMREIEFNLSLEEMFLIYDSKCALTGWELCLDYEKQTASLDRIDSSRGYTVDNIQWVHSMVNMCKNKYDQSIFVEMCKAVADKVKW